jgi:lipid-binding SYLF domain-containing protein
MARGWESKSVEEQMSIASEQAAKGLGNGVASEDALRLAEQERAQRARHKQSLALQRERILSQRTSSPARRTALEAALRQIDEQIALLG